MNSTQVSWYSVHEHVAPLLERVGSWPMVGTPEWRALDSHDERKLAALLDAAQHHALRVEIAQEARAQASRAVAAAADWTSIGRELQQLNEFRRRAPWSRRVVI